METSKLRKLIRDQLLPAAQRVYYGTAPASAERPYAVFELQELSCDDGLSLQELEVSVLDYGEDTAPAEAIADIIQTALGSFHSLTEDFHVSIYRERRQPLYEDDKLIIRRRLTFQVRLYERS